MGTAQNNDELLTVEEAAREKGISRDGIRAACRSGRLPSTRKTFGYLIRRADLKAWKARRAARARQEEAQDG